MAPKKSSGPECPVAPLGVVAPTPIAVTTPVFVGSLGMLFACVREGKVDLADIPLAPLCSAYLRHLVESSVIDLDEAAVGLAALAYLLERKAWGLLPTPEPEPEFEPERASLPEPRVQEYEQAIAGLALGWEFRSRKFFRTASTERAYEVPTQVSDIAASDLARALERLLARANPEPYELPTGPSVSLADRMAAILTILTGEWVEIEHLVPCPYTRIEAVWSFLAILELVRLGQARVRLFGESVRFSGFAERAEPSS